MKGSQASRPNTSTPRRETKKPHMRHGGQNSNSNQSSSPEPAGSKGVEFFFVSDSSSTKGKRSHVMKHHIREKRKGRNPVSPAAVAPLNKDSGVQPGRSMRMVHWKAGEEKEKEKEAGDGSPSGDERSFITELESLRETDQASPSHENPQKNAQLRRQTSRALVARVLPKSLDVDPFDSLPIAITEDMEELLKIWSRRLSYWSGQNTCIKTSMFKLAIDNASVFHTMILAYTARLRDRIEYPSAPRAAFYISAAEHILAQEMQKPKNTNEDVILAALSALSLQEERYGDKAKASQLMQDAMDRLKHRIGESIAEPFLHYTRLTQSPRLTTLGPKDTTRLFNFLHDVGTLSDGPLLILSQHTELKKIFQFGSPLHFMLAAGPWPTQVSGDDRRWVVPHDSHEPSRIAALIYIAVALLDHFNSPENVLRYMGWILHRVQEIKLDRFPSSETLLYLLLSDPYDPVLKNAWRPWLVGQLMEAVGKLSASLRFQFSEIVLRIMMGRAMDLEVSIGKFEGELESFIGLEEQQQGTLAVLPRRVEL